MITYDHYIQLFLNNLMLTFLEKHTSERELFLLECFKESAGI